MNYLYKASMVIVLFISAGCGTSGGYEDPNGNKGGDPCKDVVDGYPCAPYGHDLYDTVVDMTFYKPPYNDGDTISLSEFVADKTEKKADKIFLVTSFARWCSACMAESPELYELFTEYKDRGVVLLLTMNDGGTTAGDPDPARYGKEKITAGAQWWLENVLPPEAKNDSEFLGVLGDFDHYLDSFYDVSATPLNMILGSRFNILYKRTGWDGKEKVSGILDSIISMELEGK